MLVESRHKFTKRKYGTKRGKKRKKKRTNETNKQKRNRFSEKAALEVTRINGRRGANVSERRDRRTS